jgi:hypothetical protein
MTRPIFLLLFLTLLGVASGFWLHRAQPKDPKAKVAELTSPKSGDFADTLQMLEPGSSVPAKGGDQQMKILQDQVEYLQTQVEALQKENSQLIDKLGSLQQGTPAPNSPCAPQKMTATGETPDFVGIGIEIVRTRTLEEIPLPTVMVELSEVEKRIAKWLGTHYPRGHGVQQGRALASLGAIPAPVNTIALKAAFLSHQLGGWYDTDDQTLYVAKGFRTPDGKENALALSYGHLFKHFGQGLFPDDAKPTTLDARLARESLLAGDAGLTRFLHAMQNPQKGGGGGVGEDPDDPSRSVPIPNFLREVELLPFSMGFDFVQALHSIGDWEQVNAAYKRPPIASAEVLNPEVYLRETPFTLLPLSEENEGLMGKAPLWSDTLGPLATVLFLKQHVAEPVAAETAPGWANDRLLTYVSDSESRDHAVWRTLWQDSNAADAFFSAMRESLKSRYRGAKTPANVPADVYQIELPGHVVMLKRTHGGNGVLYIDAVDAKFAQAALNKFAP